MTLVRMFSEKVMASASQLYKRAVQYELAKTGLRYEDLLNESQREVVEALEYADPDVITGRTRRLKRAMDLNLKHKHYNDYAKDVDQETFKYEIYDTIDKIKARDQEFALLNMHKK